MIFAHLLNFDRDGILEKMSGLRQNAYVDEIFLQSPLKRCEAITSFAYWLNSNWELKYSIARPKIETRDAIKSGHLTKSCRKAHKTRV